MGLKSALAALDAAVKDLTSLHVQTFTGDINSNLDGSQTFDTIRELVKTAKTDGTVKLVAESLVQFDGDSYNFVKEDLDSVPKVALEVHSNAVQSGIDTRMGLLNLFKDGL